VAKTEAEKASITIPVGVWYDPGTGRIHLTHHAPGAPPLHTSVPKGTPMEAQFKRLLEHHGKPTPP
jgi:hypothetical protein